MTIGARDVAEITNSVWETLLEKTLIEQAGGAIAPSTGAQVRIGGAWEGRVCLKMSLDLARAVTAHIFAIPEDEVDDELIADAVRELANIVSGNIKSLLPDPSELGLPEPAGEVEGEIVVEVEMSCDDQPVVVVVEKG